MRSAGIICECNPLHGGHQYLIEQARDAGAEAVICVMSGCFTQRGDAAIADPYTRAEALIRGGADGVVELPFPYSTAGAEFFAAAGVDILTRMGVYEIWFGSEYGDLSLLQGAASAVDSPEFQALYAESAGQQEGTTQVFLRLLREQLRLSAPFSSNDILGISYLRAIKAQKSALCPATIKGQGADYRQQAATHGEFPSAMAVRNVIRDGGMDAAQPYLTADTLTLLKHAETEGTAPADLKWAERWILGLFRTIDPNTCVAELGGGLLPRMIRAAQQADSLEGLLTLAATKKYPLARLRRGILFALTGITPEDLRTLPAYTRLLAANATGCRFLAEQRKKAEIPVVTRNASLPSTPDAIRQAEWERRAYALYTLCLPTPRSPGDLLKRNPIII